MRLVLAAFMLVMASMPLRAQPADADRAAIQDVIRGQLGAFGRDDAAGAFAFASPNIQAMFGSPDTFLSMVKRGYAPVYRPRSVDFTTLTAEDSGPVQAVELIGPDGQAYTAMYTMERQPDGTWRIAACALVESRRVGT